MWKDLYKLIGTLIIFVLFTSCQPQSAGHQENHLINESSPYLLQHAYNPVDWYPWGQQALEKAEAENKLMVISVGYAACHWCHVMEDESFEDSTVADIMNKNFVSIKVDREERPDIDKIYMDAAFLMTGRGGWPLNVITLPDGRPIFAGTYFPKSDWIKVLNHLMGEFEKDPDRLSDLADQITEGIQQMERVDLGSEELEVDPEFMQVMHQGFLADIDFFKGGRKGVQKFPTPSIWQYLTNYHFYYKNDSALQAVNTTLKAMANGGIYDHLGGGFARYTVDANWRIPHFEKMLYDNAQLVSLYAQAYQLTGDTLYRRVVEETLAFVDREMKDSNGGFYSSYDADSEGEEGKYYVWTADEINSVLGEDSELIADYYGIIEQGNWEEEKNILVPNTRRQQLLSKYDLTASQLQDKLDEANQKLFEVRNERVKPPLDDKILTSWSALMACGYLDAYRVLGDDQYLETAQKTIEFLLEEAKTPQGSLNRNYKDGKSSINGFLDDYAHTVKALLMLYEASFEESWLREAESLTEYAREHFFDETSGMFFYTSDEDPELLARKMELSDNEIPSSNSTMAHNLFYLGTYLYQTEYLAKSEQMVSSIKNTAIEQPIFYGNWLTLMTQMTQPLYEVAIVGDQWDQRLKEFDQHFLPNVIYLGGDTEGNLELLENKLVEGKTTIYVCQNKSCRLPVNQTDQALAQLQQTLAN